MQTIERAKEFGVKNWVNSTGNRIAPVKLTDYKDKFVVVFCFQSWCPECHNIGFPRLFKMKQALQNNKSVAFLAIQTVFEGFQYNTFKKMIEIQQKYKLQIPFGHDAGEDDQSGSIFMQRYKTGGTPWFVIIDKKKNIVFSDFHMNPKNAINFFKEI